ncbi:DNA polymerase III subunit gamma/tau [Candidatus Peregrinibacteria bacterium]|nr:DNA polymerase III subunit gamma/tau [Candidatus Peregrinibacteria bacterium]
MSLYLKYRPINFNNLVGQDHAVTTLRNALKHKSLTHAYIFSGPRGTGKTSLARIVAKALNCLNPIDESEPCNECAICDSINKGRLVDMIEIDAASNRGIDEIRELRDKIVFAPSQAKTKVYIIDEVHMMTKDAFNALLKTLEEPPSHAYFILATTEVHKIPETIISRCQQFNFKRITQSDIVKRLQYIAEQENVTADDESLNLIAKISNGGLRDAIGLFEQMIIDGSIAFDKVAENLGLGGTIHVEKFFQNLLQRKPLKAIEILNQINAQGKSLEQFISDVISYLREQMLINLSDSNEIKIIIGFIEIFSDAKMKISQSIIPQLPLEIGVIKACNFGTEEVIELSEEKTEKPKITKEVKKEEIAEKVQIAQDKLENALSESKSFPDVSLDEVKNNWQRIVDNIETPFVRMSFLDGEPVKYEDGVLHLNFKSSTYMDKIANTSNQAVVQKAFETVLGSKIGLKLEVKKVSLNTVDTKVEDNKDSSVIEMAQEVFGGKNN